MKKNHKSNKDRKLFSEMSKVDPFQFLFYNVFPSYAHLFSLLSAGRLDIVIAYCQSKYLFC